MINDKARRCLSVVTGALNSVITCVVIGAGSLLSGPAQANEPHPMHWELPLIATEKATKDGTDIVRVEDYQGKIVYVDFWASWCHPCLKSMPFLNELRNEFHDRGFEVLAVNVDQHKKDALAFLEKHPVDYPVVYDGSNQLLEHLQVVGLPSAFLLDARGTPTIVHAGFKESDKAFLRAVIDRALALNGH